MIDIKRCQRALHSIYVQGIADSSVRKEAIEDAIKKIIEDGANALKSGYIGVKQYSGFGDQRTDCEYGMGPRHGSIVFSIGRHRNDMSVLGKDEIYLLECERDFKPLLIDCKDSYTKKREVNLTYILNQMEIKQLEIEVFEKHLELQNVESHV